MERGDYPSIKKIICTPRRQNDEIPDISPQISGGREGGNYARITKRALHEPAAGIISVITSFFRIYGLVVSLCVARDIIAIKIMTAPSIRRRRIDCSCSILA